MSKTTGNGPSTRVKTIQSTNTGRADAAERLHQVNSASNGARAGVLKLSEDRIKGLPANFGTKLV